MSNERQKIYDTFLAAATTGILADQSYFTVYDSFVHLNYRRPSADELREKVIEQVILIADDLMKARDHRLEQE